ncbi:MAG: YsnF/AvaK domain-containing protein [Acidimicrobiia bacterium]
MSGPEQDPPALDPAVQLTRAEEELVVELTRQEAGRVRVRKTVTTEPYDQVVTRLVDHAEIERVPIEDPHDSARIETLADGSISIPVLEERLVIHRELVVRERIIVRTRTLTQPEPVHAELRRVHITIEPDPHIADRVHHNPDPQPT